MKRLYPIIVLLSIVLTAFGQSGQTGRFGIRAGIGTDITFSIAGGAGFNYLLQGHRELGLMIFGGNFSETSNNGFNDYFETTKIFAIAAQANWLYNYSPGESKTFFVAGTGLAYISYYWEESSPTDISLGTPLPGGGSMQSEEGGTGGVLFTIGAGRTFSGPLDLRFEVPIMVPFGIENVGVVPLFMLTAGYRF